MKTLARANDKLRRRVDPEDVVQSAYRSFFLHAQNGEYQLDRSGDLWRLLAATTLHKLYGQIERQTAAKRSIHREATEEISLAELAGRQPTVADVIAVAEQWTLIIDGLSADERLVLTSMLQGLEPGEIARAVGKSERTVRRLLAQARHAFERQLLAVRTPPPRSPAAGDRVSAELLAPLRFTDYILEKLLGSGGMGKVYRATDKRSGKIVAIKTLHKARLHDDRAVARFVQESWILSELRHANIVGVEGLGRFPAGGYFMVMDWIDGTDMQSCLNTGPLAIGQVPASSEEVHANDRDTQAIESICRRCLAKKPADRFPTVSDLIEALKAVQTI